MKTVFLGILFVLSGQLAYAQTLVGQCTPMKAAAALPASVQIYLQETIEEAPPYYFKGSGYVQLEFANGAQQSLPVEIVNLQGYNARGAGFRLDKFKQDPNNPSPHQLTFHGLRGIYSCTSL